MSILLDAEQSKALADYAAAITAWHRALAPLHPWFEQVSAIAQVPSDDQIHELVRALALIGVTRRELVAQLGRDAD